MSHHDLFFPDSIFLNYRKHTMWKNSGTVTHLQFLKCDLKSDILIYSHGENNHRMYPGLFYE